jgi:hypothetical protein
MKRVIILVAILVLALTLSHQPLYGQDMLNGVGKLTYLDMGVPTDFSFSLIAKDRVIDPAQNVLALFVAYGRLQIGSFGCTIVDAEFECLENPIVLQCWESNPATGDVPVGWVIFVDDSAGTITVDPAMGNPGISREYTLEQGFIRCRDK